MPTEDEEESAEKIGTSANSATHKTNSTIVEFAPQVSDPGPKLQNPSTKLATQTLTTAIAKTVPQIAEFPSKDGTISATQLSNLATTEYVKDPAEFASKPQKDLTLSTPYFPFLQNFANKIKNEKFQRFFDRIS